MRPSFGGAAASLLVVKNNFPGSRNRGDDVKRVYQTASPAKDEIIPQLFFDFF